ncbi:MAG: zeta toxin family protein [Acidobacteriaceae bacterium]|nr:zeta toxin family protein [Acidobacteriaceae bacterium]
MCLLSVVAGPNGSGKSTLNSFIKLTETAHLIDPDAIAREMDPEQPSRVAIAAGREAILRCNRFIESRASFTLETTLAGHGAMRIMHDARNAGYRINMVYMALDRPELHFQRVRLRVSEGGHDVPPADIERRYHRSLLHAPEALRIADEGMVVDNAGPHPVIVALIERGVILWRATTVPEWVQNIQAQLES